MNIITVGIDLAKNVFAVHGVDDNGKPALVKPKVTRADLLPLIANLPLCTIGMEACSGTHPEDLPGYANLCIGGLLAHTP